MLEDGSSILYVVVYKEANTIVNWGCCLVGLDNTSMNNLSFAYPINEKYIFDH